MNILETSLYEDIIRGARLEGWLLFRITDGSPGRKPFDISGSAPNGLAVGVEVKVWRKKGLPTKVPWDQFESQQVHYLVQYAKRKSYAFALIYCDKEQKMLMFRLTENDSFVITEMTKGAVAWYGWPTVTMQGSSNVLCGNNLLDTP